ncbi:hypothetical protein H5410_031007 [Solanum commersonii]|uniref:Integrase core domain containing protein n=1 Tax=Solanum commersonii TaxID=4109 RepID=A0A9J5YHV9_SOLCO|nr:hypothetical protein H5410_031007 [Solanum commersonii]
MCLYGKSKIHASLVYRGDSISFLASNQPETDEELIAVHEEETQESHDESIFRDLLNLMGSVVHPVIQLSLTETSTATPSGSGTSIPLEVSAGTETRDQTDASGTDALIQTDAQADGATA